MNIKITRLHERCLRIIYNDKMSSFADLLAKDGSATIHTRNLQVLAIEIFKVRKNISLTIVLKACQILNVEYRT